MSEGDGLNPPKNGWRPFEWDPGNCIGQEPALTEIKVMLALTIREFDVRHDYEEYDSLKKNPRGCNINGQRAYMIRRGWGISRESLPVQSDLCACFKEEKCRVSWDLK